MKKLLLLGLFGAMAMSAVAQGTVQFQNSAFSPIRIVRNGVTNAVNPSDGLVVGLFYGTSAGTATNLVGTASFVATNGVFAGNTVFAIPGTNPGDIGFFNVAAWESSFGATAGGMAQAIAAGGFWGSAQSSGTYGIMGTPLQFSLAPTAGPGTVMFGSTATPNVFHLFAVTAVPEPSTLALGGLGIAALLMFRRKK